MLNRDLETWIRGHSRSLKLVSLKSLGAVSYSPSIVTMVVSVTVCEISKSGVTLKTGLGFVQGHLKWYHLIYAYEFLFVFHSNYDDIFYRLRDILVENRKNFIPHLYLATPLGVPRRNFVKMFDACKTRMIGLPYGGKNYD